MKAYLQLLFLKVILNLPQLEKKNLNLLVFRTYKNTLRKHQVPDTTKKKQITLAQKNNQWQSIHLA